MFTGIIEEVGTVDTLDVGGDAARLRVNCQEVLTDVHVGDSIAVSGVCLTVTSADAGAFEADLVAETLRVTTLGSLSEGDGVNLERAMAADGRLGGHLVQGHVDAVASVVEVLDGPGTRVVRIGAPQHLMPYVVPKGSVTLEGVSLTVVDTTEVGFEVALIPHTREVTTLGRLVVGSRLNVEIDVIAKYVARLLSAGAPSPYVGGSS